jgi:hypothetical protein
MFGVALLLLIPLDAPHMEPEPVELGWPWIAAIVAFAVSRGAALLAKTDHPISAVLKLVVFMMWAFLVAVLKADIPGVI